MPHYQESQLEKWMAKQKVSTQQLAQKVGCTRQVLWKVKRGLAICPAFANKIYELTDKEVTPLMKKVGRDHF